MIENVPVRKQAVFHRAPDGHIHVRVLKERIPIKGGMNAVKIENKKGNGEKKKESQRQFGPAFFSDRRQIHAVGTNRPVFGILTAPLP